MKVEAIVVAAGRGKRLESSVSKPLVLLNGRPIFIYTLEAILRSPLVDDIIVVAGERDIEQFQLYCKKYDLKKIKKIIVGGKSRSISVRNGLKEIAQDTDLVLIHDGVRPFVNGEIISKTILAAKDFGAAIVAIPVTSTVKRINPKDLEVEQTLDRDSLCEIQTPQVFKRDIIIKAYNEMKDRDYKDDASLVEELGFKVKIVEGSATNFKITTPEDLLLAQIILKNKDHYAN